MSMGRRRKDCRDKPRGEGSRGDKEQNQWDFLSVADLELKTQCTTRVSEAGVVPFRTMVWPERNQTLCRVPWIRFKGPKEQKNSRALTEPPIAVPWPSCRDHDRLRAGIWGRRRCAADTVIPPAPPGRPDASCGCTLAR
jgi:hypothetical protein